MWKVAAECDWHKLVVSFHHGPSQHVDGTKKVWSWTKFHLPTEQHTKKYPRLYSGGDVSESAIFIGNPKRDLSETDYRYFAKCANAAWPSAKTRSSACLLSARWRKDQLPRYRPCRWWQRTNRYNQTCPRSMRVFELHMLGDLWV